MQILSFEEEARHLGFITDFLKVFRADLEMRQGRTAEGIVGTRYEINENISNAIDFEDGNVMEFVQMLPEIRTTEMNFNYIHTMLERTKRMIPKPYFGKITVDGEAIYIGTGTIKNKDNDILIYDWRTPVASLFYENRTGDLSYIIPDGSRIDATVEQRRQFIIEDGTLVNMFDSDMYIGDEILQNMITDSSQSRLKNIVSTIQQEQNDIIRLPLSRDTLVYGPPGSGKTSLAMQRIAYLLYQHKNTLNPENILLVSPNEVFNDYLSDVLPELGENHVKNTTFYRLLSRFPYFKGRNFEHVYENIRRLRESDSGHAIYEYKNSIDYFSTLHQFIQSLGEAGMEFRNLVGENGMFYTKEGLAHIFYNELSAHPVRRRLAKMQERLLSRYTEEIRRLTEERFKALHETNTYIGEENELKKEAHEYAKKQLRVVHRQISLFRFVHFEKLYLNSIGDRKFRNQTVRSIKENDFKYEDIAPLLYLYIHVLGRTDRQIQHVLIDEVQDYSNIQYYVMRHFYQKATFTSLGDPNQQIHPGRKDPLIARDHTEKRLEQSYRSTNQINAFLNSIIPGSIKSVSVDGDEVQKIRTDDEIEYVKALLRNDEHPQVAIITPTRAAADAYYKALESEFPQIKNLGETDTLYNQSFIVLPYYLSKGFEYNTVILTSAHDYADSKHILYVLASRATRHLHLLNPES
ncbi:UvrD-helicase domain-containing protein [Salinicoccus sp. ID82-1]|uniref:HelD family protein n=1 Tax=Salinicoccus sp. ID82-1 TaxID=2820269 RepID=UPI001F01802D|nr:UvrD-helicase domain-containing protein [Salinicoccus sp. ID82-1]MCG1010691.1 UvrD-helicase domain-containing protein [Salinicoccus sp. ID82-1]